MARKYQQKKLFCTLYCSLRGRRFGLTSAQMSEQAAKARANEQRSVVSAKFSSRLRRSPLTLPYKIATYAAYSYWSVDYHFYMATQFTPRFSFCKAEAVPPDVE